MTTCNQIIPFQLFFPPYFVYFITTTKSCGALKSFTSLIILVIIICSHFCWGNIVVFFKELWGDLKPKKHFCLFWISLYLCSKKKKCLLHYLLKISDHQYCSLNVFICLKMTICTRLTNHCILIDFVIIWRMPNKEMSFQAFSAISVLSFSFFPF